MDGFHSNEMGYLRSYAPVCKPLPTHPLQVWSERPFTERDESGLMGQAIKGVEKLYAEGLFFPEEIALHRKCMRRYPIYGNLSNAYVDSFGTPRSTFGRMIAIAGPMTENAVALEMALPTAMCMLHWADERVPQVGNTTLILYHPAPFTVLCLPLIPPC